MNFESLVRSLTDAHTQSTRRRSDRINIDRSSNGKNGVDTSVCLLQDSKQ